MLYITYYGAYKRTNLINTANETQNLSMFQGNNIFHSKLTVFQVSSFFERDNYAPAKMFFPSLIPSFSLLPFLPLFKRDTVKRQYYLSKVSEKSIHRAP